MQADVIVLGAGIVGVSVAIALAERGKSVVLVDRRAPGEETSFGNAGLIQREGVAPHEFPRDWMTILRHGRNKSTDSSYHPDALPGLVPFLARYWHNSRADRYKMIQRLYEPLIAQSTDEHWALIEKSGAQQLIGKNGWLKAFRTKKGFDGAMAGADAAKAEFGVDHDKLSSADFARTEPDFLQPLAGAIRWKTSWTIADPHALTMAYVAYFQALGGSLLTGDATTLAGKGSGWQVTTSEGPVEAGEVVLALGPWADTVTRRLGYRLPLAVKRGYHMHYAMQDGAKLNNWFMDAEVGYMLAPMAHGIRLTTGAEFARRDAPQTPVQLGRADQAARQLVRLGGRIDPKPWMGSRPATPDMMPIIGPAPRHKGLWFAFGHAHHGMTLGPVTGRLLAEQMTGETPFLDPSPYFATRFGA